MRIQTSYWQPPIPLRTFDWSAWDADLGEDQSPIGWGRTRQEAVDDLLEQIALAE